MDTIGENVTAVSSEGTIPSTTEEVEQKLQLQKAVQGAAGWFFWIAGLSVINSIIIMSEGEFNFIFGLGITQVIDVIIQQADMLLKVIGYGINLFAIAAFAVFGYFARQRYKWAFIVGLVLYALDGLLFLFIQDWLGVGFHVFAAIMIFSGFSKIDQLKAQEEKLKTLN